MKYKIMKFAANRSHEGKDIEVTKIASKSGNVTVKEMLTQIIIRLDKIEERLDKHEKILNDYKKLFIQHGWIK